MLGYVSGPYGPKTVNGLPVDWESEATQQAIEDNIATARKVAIACWEKGHATICPHLNTAHMERDCKLQWEGYIKGDLAMIARVDFLIMVPGWEDSRGSNVEKSYAEGLGIPVYFYPAIPELHPTEVRSPVQCGAFSEFVGRMYRKHLDKNADYSPANIAGTGEIGLMTRLWDKVSRLMNLMGFRIDVQYLGFDAARTPRNESIEDNLLDATVYPAIWLLYRSGKWGH